MNSADIMQSTVRQNRLDINNNNNGSQLFSEELTWELYTLIYSSCAWFVFFILLIFSYSSIWFSISSILLLILYDIIKGIISGMSLSKSRLFAESEDFKDLLESIFMVLYKV